MKKILIVIALMFATLAFAQNDEAYVDGLVSEFTTKLEQRNIQSYFSTKRHCLGNVQMFQMPQGKMCSSNGTYFETYVFWKEEDGKAMIKKFDNCGIFTSVQTQEVDLISFMNNNMKKLRETVRNYKVTNPENTPAQSAKTHPCSKEFNFVVNGVSYGQDFKDFYLTNESKYPNLNYEYNKSLKVVELDAMISEIVSTYDRQGKFVRLQL